MFKGLKLALSDGWVDRTRERVTGFVVGTVKNAVDELLDWLIKHGIRFGVAAAVLVTAAVLAVTAAKEGIVALGAPPALVSLGLALVCALAGIILFKSGPRRPRKEIESEPYPGLSIRISRRARTRTRGARARGPRRRRRAVYDVHRASKGWEVTGQGRARGHTFHSKRAAIRAAERDAERDGGSRIVIHRSDGTVQHTERLGGSDVEDRG